MVASGGRNEIPSMTIPSGYSYYKWHMMIGFVAMAILYISVIYWFDSIVKILNLPPSAPEFCPTSSEPCWRADLFSFEVVSGIALTWCGILGFYCWHFQLVENNIYKKSHVMDTHEKEKTSDKKSLAPLAMIPTTTTGRLFGYIPIAHQLTAIGTTFQLFDLFISLLIPEQRQFLFIAHHIMAATVSWYGLNNQYFHYYGVFYLGCSEVSTIPLVMIDMSKFFPPIPGSNFDFLVGAICGPMFAVTFTLYRVIWWWQVAIPMYRDIYQVLQQGQASKLRPGRNHVLYVMFILNFLLGMLQLYWFTIILQEAAVFFGMNTTSATTTISTTNA